MYDEDGVRQRFRYAFQTQNALGKQTKQIAEELGVPASTARSWANGSKTPSVRHWPQLARILGENENYFLYGEPASADVQRLELREVVAELSSTVAELTELLQPILDGEPIPRDPTALRALGRALGRKPQADP